MVIQLSRLGGGGGFGHCQEKLPKSQLFACAVSTLVHLKTYLSANHHFCLSLGFQVGAQPEYGSSQVELLSISVMCPILCLRKMQQSLQFDRSLFYKKI